MHDIEKSLSDAVRSYEIEHPPEIDRVNHISLNKLVSPRWKTIRSSRL